jgi:hypothetical protein
MSVWIVLPGGNCKRFQNRQTRHHCGKRRKGRPRVGYGLCCGHDECPGRVERRFLKTQLRKAERSELGLEEIGCVAPPRGARL